MISTENPTVTVDVYLSDQNGNQGSQIPLYSSEPPITPTTPYGIYYYQPFPVIGGYILLKNLR